MILKIFMLIFVVSCGSASAVMIWGAPPSVPTFYIAFMYWLAFWFYLIVSIIIWKAD